MKRIEFYHRLGVRRMELPYFVPRVKPDGVRTLDMLLTVGEVAKPMANIDGLTIVSTDGASKLTGTTADILSQTTAVARELGVDLTAIFNGLGKSSSVNELPPAPVKTDEK